MTSYLESSPSLKRRKILPIGEASSANAKAPASSYRSSSPSLSGISRRLFKSQHGEGGITSGNRGLNVQQSLNSSKEGALNGEDTARVLTPRVADTYAEDSESADELACATTTITPIKPQRSRLRLKEQTPKTAEKKAKDRATERPVGEPPAEICANGRGRRRPRQYSSGEADTLRPTPAKGISSPDSKGIRSPRKAVSFGKDGDGIVAHLDFKDLDKRSETKFARASRRKEPYHSPAALGQVDDDAHQLSHGHIVDGPPREPRLQDEAGLHAPGLTDVTAAPTDLSPVLVDAGLDHAKSLVLSRLTGQILTPLTALEAEYNKLHSLLGATVKAGEGNSILLLGSRGAGKTCLVETAIADLAVQHARDFHVVRLHGFLQTDDKLALREIWRQLGREMQVELDETAQVNTYADTMASLLHLLSHPDEHVETVDPDAPASIATSVIFVIDEFDLFTTHPRQTLLYNLFDIAQARKAPIAVVGCSARIDVMEALEKRVKSRFSHRWIHLSQAKSFSTFEDIAKAALIIQVDDSSPAGQSISAETRVEWNYFIENVFLLSSHIRGLLQQLFYSTKSIPDLFSSLYMEIATIDSLDRTSIQPAVVSYLPFPDSVLDILPQLPSLHLSLLIAAARLEAIHSATVVTFPLVYMHYVDLISRLRLQASAAGSIAQATKLWTRDLAAAAWEEMAEWEIILPAAGKGIEGELTKTWKCDVVLEEIVEAVGGTDGGMSDVMIRWCKEI